ncbi:MAG TPA: hypothetical protein VEC11_16120 [Allosphingosinicella sp.]|nr:hypothetical protein [Allosphingosinicella sp.]
MRGYWIAAAGAVAITAITVPAQACVYSPPLNLEDVRHAEMVVVGRIVNYRIVRDEAARRERRVLEARWPGLGPQAQRRRAQRTSFLSDYASFDILVEQVLVGQAGRVVSVTWTNSTFGEPAAMPEGRYLVALRRRIGTETLSPVSPPVR